MHYTRNAVAVTGVYVPYATFYEQKRGFLNVPKEPYKLKRGETGFTGFSPYLKETVECKPFVNVRSKAIYASSTIVLRP